jgi:hypothetical protein
VKYLLNEGNYWIYSVSEPEVNAPPSCPKTGWATRKTQSNPTLSIAYWIFSETEKLRGIQSFDQGSCGKYWFDAFQDYFKQINDF